MKTKPTVPIITINEYDIRYALSEDGDYPLPSKHLTKEGLTKFAQMVRAEMTTEEFEPFWDTFYDIIRFVAKREFGVENE